MLTSTEARSDLCGQSRQDEDIERSRLPNKQNLFCSRPFLSSVNKLIIQTHSPPASNFLWQLLKRENPKFLFLTHIVQFEEIRIKNVKKLCGLRCVYQL